MSTNLKAFLKKITRFLELNYIKIFPLKGVARNGCLTVLQQEWRCRHPRASYLLMGSCAALWQSLGGLQLLMRPAGLMKSCFHERSTTSFCTKRVSAFHVKNWGFLPHWGGLDRLLQASQALPEANVTPSMRSEHLGCLPRHYCCSTADLLSLPR